MSAKEKNKIRFKALILTVVIFIIIVIIALSFSEPLTSGSRNDWILIAILLSVIVIGYFIILKFFREKED